MIVYLPSDCIESWILSELDLSLNLWNSSSLSIFSILCQVLCLSSNLSLCSTWRLWPTPVFQTIK